MGDRTKRLEAILQWCIRQQEEEGERIQGPPGPQIEPERQRWLKEALEAFTSQPSETDLLNAALAVLKTHSSRCCTATGTVLSDAGLKSLEEAFEQVKYFVEDLDHANDLIPLNGVEVIVDYLHCDNMILTKLSCELIAVASQNNPPCQKAFLPTIMRLLFLIKDAKSTENVKIQAVRAISSLLKAKIGDVIPAVSTLLKTCSDSEMLEHTLSLLTALLQHHLADMKKHHGVNAILKETLVEIQSRLSPNEHKDELDKLKQVIQRLSDV